jgi:3',5'-cyclic-AMP phosphodiesterase
LESAPVPPDDGHVVGTVNLSVFRGSSVWGVITQFRLQIGMIPRSEQSFGTPQGFAGEADLRVFVCHYHLVPVPGTGRERNQVLDAGDVLSLLRQCEVDLVLSGHRHVPYVWPIAGMLLVHSGTVSTLRTRGFPNPAYNLIRVEAGRISVEMRRQHRGRDAG